MIIQAKESPVDGSSNYSFKILRKQAKIFYAVGLWTSEYLKENKRDKIHADKSVFMRFNMEKLDCPLDVQ